MVECGGCNDEKLFFVCTEKLVFLFFWVVEMLLKTSHLALGTFNILISKSPFFAFNPRKKYDFLFLPVVWLFFLFICYLILIKIFGRSMLNNKFWKHK